MAGDSRSTSNERLDASDDVQVGQGHQVCVVLRGGESVATNRTDSQIRQAEQLRASGEPVPEIAATLGVSRATLYRALAE
jgi:hypothetical protein